MVDEYNGLGVSIKLLPQLLHYPLTTIPRFYDVTPTSRFAT